MKRTTVKWLGDKPATHGGVTWGVPWAKGVLGRRDPLKAEDEHGNVLPLQSWPTAYWPDGSVKWSAHAAAFTKDAPNEFYLSICKGEKEQALSNSIKIEENQSSIIIHTGAMECSFNKSGNQIIKEMKTGNKLVCAGGELVCRMEERTKTSGLDTAIITEYKGHITDTVIEQSGPVRCVIRVKGSHVSIENPRDFARKKLIPFDVRFYLYAGSDSVKIMHTFVYNANPSTDFIKGLGIRFLVPQSGELYNRQVAFAGDTGIFREMPKTLATSRTTGKYLEMYERQLKGEALEFNGEEDAKFLGLLDEAAVWNHFKIVQLLPSSYSVFKRTKEECCFIKALTGKQAKGLAYAGGQEGGLAASIRNFWQKSPTSIEIKDMATSQAEMMLWFWSPDARAMDLRHYDTETHLYSAYEGFQEMRATPYGIANTSEAALWCLNHVPGSDELMELAVVGAEPPQPVCEPGTYKKSGVFGEWGLVDRSTPEKAYIEDQLDAILDFYQTEIEVRDWYGFWDYGDVMHTYDHVRHSWRYDIGGFAWQNTELMPNMWLWYSFLRSGRQDVYRLAEAMTRHNAEVDVYHIGEYAGLGSRHNVTHWGCGAKEARISMAALNRYYYYLTADERMGDLLDEVKDADLALARLDPMRATIEKDSRFDTHVRTGPDIMAFCSNWFTQWERYEDERYKEKLFKSLNFLKENPHRFIAGKVYGYNVFNTEYHDINVSHKDGHFHYCFGSQFIWVEMAQALEDTALEQMCVSLGEFHTSFAKDVEGVLEYWGESGINRNMIIYHTGLAAYAAYKTNNPALAQEVWKVMLNPEKTWMTFPVKPQPATSLEYPVDVSEIRNISTNSISQWTINAIMCLGLIG